MTRLVLRQQISDFKANCKVSVYVPLRALARRNKNVLKNTFRAIERPRDRVKTELTVGVF